MGRALDLARRGEGLTRPNPPVGAVVVSGNRAVGEGYHRRAGGPHAEVTALAAAGRRARGSTLYVTLEPCSTWGRTPPCTDRILAAGVRSVVVAVKDPNPAHAGRGLAHLQREGVRVVVGVCGEEGHAVVAPFAKWITEGLPYLTLKLGLSVDGKLADARHASRWITGEQARRQVQELRRRVDALLVGAGTVRDDNPQLVPRPAYGRAPYRVVVSGRGCLPDGCRVLTDRHAARTIVATARPCPARQRRRWERAGIEVLELPSARKRVPVRPLLRALAARGILHVLAEGGGQMAESLIRADVVDEYLFFVAPCILGGEEAVNAVGGKGWLLADKPELVFTGCELCGADVLLRARPK